MSTSGVAVRAGDRASRSGVSAAMSGEDERASRPRGAPSPPDVPSTSSSGPRDTARPEDAEARSPRSRERLARAKAEVAALAARVRWHDPSAISGGVSFAPSDPRVIAAPLDASGARVYDRDRLGSHGTLSRRGDSWWFFDTHPEFVRETLASDAAVMRCPHLIGNRPTRAPHAIVTERRADDAARLGRRHESGLAESDACGRREVCEHRCAGEDGRCGREAPPMVATGAHAGRQPVGGACRPRWCR